MCIEKSIMHGLKDLDTERFTSLDDALALADKTRANRKISATSNFKLYKPKGLKLKSLLIISSTNWNSLF